MLTSKLEYQDIGKLDFYLSIRMEEFCQCNSIGGVGMLLSPTALY